MFSNLLFSNALWAALVIGAFLPIVGRYLILSRSILLGLVIPQLAMAGIAFVFLASALHWPGAETLSSESSQSLVGSLLFGIPALLLIASPWQTRSRANDAWLAVIYLLAVGVTNLMLANNAVGETYLDDLFHGRLLFIGAEELRLLTITLGATFLLMIGLRKRLTLTIIDSDYAKVTGLSVGIWATLGVLISGTAIGVTVATAGPLVTFGFLVLPTLIAATFTESLRANLLISILAALLTAWVGFRLSLYFDTPLGDTIITTGCFFLLLTRGFRPLIRKRGEHHMRNFPEETMSGEN